MNDLKYQVCQRLIQWLTSMIAGFLVAVETSIDFFVPCLIAVILDVISAYFLGRRVHKKFPDKSDGKFKSEYKLRIMTTMIVAWLFVILASYIDVNVRNASDEMAVRCFMNFGLAWKIGHPRMTNQSPRHCKESW